MKARQRGSAGGRVSRLPGMLILAQIKANSLPAPVQEFRFCDTRRWRFDYCWPDRLVALEVEGGVYVAGRHSRGKGMENDMEKYNAAAILGWRVLRYSTGQMRERRWLADLMQLLY